MIPESEGVRFLSDYTRPGEARARKGSKSVQLSIAFLIRRRTVGTHMALPTHLHRSEWESFVGHSPLHMPCNRSLSALDKGLPLEVIHKLCEPQVSVGQGPRSMAKDDPFPIRAFRTGR